MVALTSEFDTQVVLAIERPGVLELALFCHCIYCPPGNVHSYLPVDHNKCSWETSCSICFMTLVVFRLFLFHEYGDSKLSFFACFVDPDRGLDNENNWINYVISRSPILVP